MNGPGAALTAPTLADKRGVDVAERTCSIDGCDQPHDARGWCHLHYTRWWRYGSVLWQPPTTADRFWAKVDKSGGPDACWPWTAGRGSRRGRMEYGHFAVERRPVPAHVWSWEQANGPVPVGKILDHFRCDNPPCVNPAHLRPVTQRENILRGGGLASANAAKTHCPRGHPYDEANTYVGSPQAGRQCKACRRP